MTEPLAAHALRRTCDASALGFATTDDLSADAPFVGHERAIEALEFGIEIPNDGYNVFALGPGGTGRRRLVQQQVAAHASDRSTPPDWCYVNNFSEERTPQLMQLPTGRGTALCEDMEQFIEDVKTALLATFESEDYQTRRQAVQEEAQEEQEAALDELQERAREENIALIRTPNGFAFAPIKDGEVVSPEEIDTLDEERREALQEKIEQFQEELQQILRKVPERQRAARKQIQQLNREMAEFAVNDLLEELQARYDDLEQVVDYLQAVRADIIENVEAFVRAAQSGSSSQNQAAMQQQSQQSNGLPGALWRRYRVNVLVDNSDTEGAPVIYEDNPNYRNLVGEVEQIAQMGALVTDFNLIQPGALHKANGGYLIIEARKLLTQPYAWEGLKRALQNNEIQIESPGEALGLIRTVTLEPEAAPLDVKVVLVGERMLYYLLSAYDPDMEDLFKVMADFDDNIDHTDAARMQYARMLATLVDEQDLRPLDASAVARVVEHSMRLVDDTKKLSTHRTALCDLVTEASYWAGKDAADVVSRTHVQQALDAQERRADRLRERVQESIARDTIYIDTEGSAVGQVNGLSVLQQDGFAFGKPNRITARVRLGSGDIVDIERETELGGPLHAKGVLILSGFLEGRFAQEHPLSLSASLVFEQSYGGIDGDSASSAELYALLSAIADLPLKQSLAVTGSVNQHGVIQPIGGVNEKIEEFYDTCQAAGLTGSQGVIIPQSNVEHLMLRPEVVAAAEAGTFHIYPVRTVDEGIALLTGQPAGTRADDGTYPEGTVNRAVADRLAAMADQRRAFASPNGTADEAASHE
ncbi:Lon protease family protein [Salisaeta longa]|uniref:Lon protease family protein n=1 Tax=Salisaeta longa TaxID=503170 RepID=UPI0003B71E21|nr:AAA family ATPase [Salisaeta longa]